MKSTIKLKDQSAKSMQMLPKAVYGLSMDPTTTPFGFVNGQIRANSAMKNAWWFNLAGEKLGYGDLTFADLCDIAVGISTTEHFFLVSEFDCVWAMPKGLNASEPGLDYVLKNCIWAVSARTVDKISDTLTAPVIDPNEPYVIRPRADFERDMRAKYMPKKPKLTVAPAEKDLNGDIDKLIQANLKAMGATPSPGVGTINLPAQPRIHPAPQATQHIPPLPPLFINPPVPPAAKPSPAILPVSPPYAPIGPGMGAPVPAFPAKKKSTKQATP